MDPNKGSNMYWTVSEQSGNIIEKYFYFWAVYCSEINIRPEAC